MKRILFATALALISCMAANAQDSTAKKHRTHPSYDTMPRPSDSTGKRKWNNSKKPGDKRKNWPDSMGRIPDSLRAKE